MFNDRSSLKLFVFLLAIVGGGLVWRGAVPSAREPVLSERLEGRVSSVITPGDAAARAPTATAFDVWRRDWLAAAPEDRRRLEAVGVAAAQERRARLKQLIASDPRGALREALTRSDREGLPAAVQALLEVPIDARGDFFVGVSCFGDREETLRGVMIDGVAYAASVFGRRATLTSRRDIPLHGIALDGAVALADSAYRVLEPEEKTVRGLPPEALAVLVGTDLVSLPDRAALATLDRQLMMAEAGDPASAGHPTLAAMPPASWIMGPKRVLYIRADFPDDPGSPATEAQIAASMAAVDQYYRDVSRGRTSMTLTLFPTVLRLSKAKGSYPSSQGHLQIGAEVIALAKQYDQANGGTGLYDPDKVDRYVILFPRNAAYPYAGIANLGEKGTYLNGDFSAHVTAHELGHNHGFLHSLAWASAGGSTISPNGSIDFSGDVFDMMDGAGVFDTSGANLLRAHLNVAQKALAGYLDTNETPTVTQSGTYRLFRHDDARATGVLALRIVSAGAEYDYWLEHRRQIPPLASPLSAANVDRLQNGVLVHWRNLPRFVPDGYDGSPFLLDMTPGGSAHDAPLKVGETFLDASAGVTIRPLAVGGAAPNEYIDVFVGIGATGTNRNPTLAATAPSPSLTARTNVAFTAVASDPDGDVVSYLWDFGDGVSAQFNPKTPYVTYSYLNGGNYSVRVSAIDNKGGIATTTYPVTVNEPLRTWVRRGTDLLGGSQLADVVYSAGQFVAVGAPNLIIVSPDGVSWSRASGPPNPQNVTRSYNSVAYGAGRYVAVGNVLTSGSVPTVAWSTNGTTWTEGVLPAGTAGLGAVAFGAEKFVAVSGSDRKLYSSPDGATWTGVTAPTLPSLDAISFSNGLFVATGAAAGAILTSADGVTWTNRSVGTPNGFLASGYFAGKWFAFNPFNYWSSGDGVVWKNEALKGIGSAAPREFVELGGTLVGPQYDQRRLLISQSGLQWGSVDIADESVPTSVQLRGIATGNAATVMVGYHATGSRVTDATGLIYALSAAALPPPPIVVASPQSQTAVLGGGVTLSVFTEDSRDETYQWLFNNVPLAGATSANLALANLTSAQAGNYSVIVRKNGLSVVSPAANLSLVSPSAVPSSWISNVSIRTKLNADDVVIVGVSVSGGAKPVLVRAVGPTLVAYGVADAMPDPRFRLFDAAGIEQATNDNWGGLQGIVTAAAANGAFPLVSNASRDAALLRSLNGGYTVHVSGPTAGTVLVEAYDAGTGNTPRLVNVSARNFCGRGDGVLIAGFYVLGTGSKRILLRAVGPTLANYGVSDVLADPKLEIFPVDQPKILENDTYAGSLAPLFPTVGAFPLNAGSKDAAIVATLPPGGYTVVVSGADGGVGNAIIEVYELP